jgi:hypothetical protein
LWSNDAYAKLTSANDYSLNLLTSDLEEEIKKDLDSKSDLQELLCFVQRFKYERSQGRNPGTSWPVGGVTRDI